MNAFFDIVGALSLVAVVGMLCASPFYVSTWAANATLARWDREFAAERAAQAKVREDKLAKKDAEVLAEIVARREAEDAREAEEERLAAEQERQARAKTYAELREKQEAQYQAWLAAYPYK